ncbi:MAG: hypothetical protein A2383_01780 [Candidatus Pacebacteria bacterium RIFOXYB1_FULL_39_46]|nr:MAG: hypothetical protein A2182_03295 [Candidatus Pacebacteria bacterium RIFOXYA1_FULL_38_18]OGJ37899.1 MAG: hypothetical protein A2383_01780 [Candidatus Pacebacteria bacterium RIFOXYB1_FULL_39_46]OGJ39498.1 MAG: hypothetical protein A2411_01935 [Candidatus Pacebacteria bacterium RIFOXYC1_FULL_39_21]OGJ40078.1 MAG: hypothetical protein A2582_03225 [Candidatus Pacebacteria bacterium RIFOXYD1_FULL_39_27]
MILIISLGIILGGIFLAIRKMRISQGMWYSFDDVHVIRTVAMAHELERGQFPVRILSDFGNGGGYLFFNFYSPLVYYLTAGLVFLGNHPLNAVKLAFQLCYLLGALGMWTWLRRLFPQKPWVAVIGSLLLIGSGYFNYDAYVRGSLGELSGFALTPWLFWLYENLKTSPRNKLSIGLLALAISTFMYVHMITAFIVLPFLGLRWIWDLYFHQLKPTKRWNLAWAGLLSIGLSASYLLPVIVEKSLVWYSQIDYVTQGFQSGFVSFVELVGWQKNADPTILPMTVGSWLSLSAGIAIIFSWQQLKRLTGKQMMVQSSLWWFAVSGLLLALFIQSKWSRVIWENSSLLQMTQFPSRYLMIISLLAVLIVSLGLANWKKDLIAILLGITLLSLTWWQNQPLMTPSGYYFTDEFRAEDLCSSSTWQYEYLPKWTQECLPKGHSFPIATSSEALEILDVQVADNLTSLEIKTNGKPGELIITRYYFPGWQIKSDQQILESYPVGKYGLLGARISTNQTQLSVQFTDTPIRTWANNISISSLIIGLWLITTDSITLIRKKLKLKFKKP